MIPTTANPLISALLACTAPLDTAIGDGYKDLAAMAQTCHLFQRLIPSSKVLIADEITDHIRSLFLTAKNHPVHIIVPTFIAPDFPWTVEMKCPHNWDTLRMGVFCNARVFTGITDSNTYACAFMGAIAEPEWKPEIVKDHDRISVISGTVIVSSARGGIMPLMAFVDFFSAQGTRASKDAICMPIGSSSFPSKTEMEAIYGLVVVPSYVATSLRYPAGSIDQYSDYVSTIREVPGSVFAEPDRKASLN